MLVSQCRSLTLIRSSIRFIIGRWPIPTLRLCLDGGGDGLALGMGCVLSRDVVAGFLVWVWFA